MTGNDILDARTFQQQFRTLANTLALKVGESRADALDNLSERMEQTTSFSEQYATIMQRVRWGLSVSL